MRLLNRPLNITWGETNKLFVNAYSEVETIPGNGCKFLLFLYFSSFLNQTKEIKQIKTLSRS